MLFQDRSLVCRECGAEFVFTTGEQEFFWSKGLENQPNRCPSCRTIKRERNNVQNLNNFGNQQMFEVSCQQCGNPAYVPFQPDGRRPVLCRECFERLRYR